MLNFATMSDYFKTIREASEGLYKEREFVTLAA